MSNNDTQVADFRRRLRLPGEYSPLHMDIFAGGHGDSIDFEISDHDGQCEYFEATPEQVRELIAVLSALVGTDQQAAHASAKTSVYRVITPEGDTRESAEGFTYMTDEGWLHPEPGDRVERAVLEWETDYVVPNEDAPGDDE